MSKSITSWPLVVLRFSLTLMLLFGLGSMAGSSMAQSVDIYFPLIVTTSPSVAIWISKDELMALPTSGTAWEELKARADAPLGVGNVGDQNSSHDINTLAMALVAARTEDPTYRDKAIEALMSIIGTDEQPDSHCEFTPNKARSLAIARNLTAYIVAADLINFRAGTDHGKGDQWQSYIDMLRFKPNCPNVSSGSYPDGDWLNLSQSHDQSGSNASAQAGAARIAAALYLNDRNELEQAWQTYQRYAGDQSKCPLCPMNINESGITWAHDPNNPAAINPAGATKSGHSIDGAIISDIGRGGAFTWPPEYTNYPWVGMEGFIAQAHMLARAGYPAWEVSQQAPRRAVAYLKYLSEEFGETWWDRTHWVKYLVNNAYQTDFPADTANSGFIMAWTDWTHGQP